MCLASNCTQAKVNLSLRPQLEDGKAALAIKYQELQEIREACWDKQQRLGEWSTVDGMRQRIPKAQHPQTCSRETAHLGAVGGDAACNGMDAMVGCRWLQGCVWGCFSSGREGVDAWGWERPQPQKQGCPGEGLLAAPSLPDTEAYLENWSPQSALGKLQAKLDASEAESEVSQARPL